jgi:hypothetical protein
MSDDDELRAPYTLANGGARELSALSGLSTGSVVRILRGDAIIDPGTQERLAALDR